MVTRLRACRSLTFASRVSSYRKIQTGSAKDSVPSNKTWETFLLQDSHHFWQNAAELLLVKDNRSTCSSARVADSLTDVPTCLFSQLAQPGIPPSFTTLCSPRHVLLPFFVMFIMQRRRDALTVTRVVLQPLVRLTGELNKTL